MSFLKPKPEERGEVTVMAPVTAAEDLRVLAQKCNARELAMLRKVVENPTLKQMALGAAQKFIK